MHTHTHTHCYVLVNVPFYVQTFTCSILIKEVVLVLWHWFNGCSWFLFLSSEHSFFSIYHACVVVKHVIHQHLYCICVYTSQSTTALPVMYIQFILPRSNVGSSSSGAHVMADHPHHAAMSDGDSHNVTVVIDDDTSTVATATDSRTATMDNVSGA